VRVSRETGEVAVRAVTEAGGRRCPSATRSCMRPAVRSLAVGRESGSGRQNDFNIAGRTFYESRPMHQLSSCLLLLVTAHVKVCHVAYAISKTYRSEASERRDVLIVRRQHNDRGWKFKEQHAKMWENIAGAKRYSRPRGFNIAGASAAAVPTPRGAGASAGSARWRGSGA